MAHKNIPKRDDIDKLAGARAPFCVSIYTPVGTLREDSELARLELKNQLREVVRQLKDAGAKKTEIERLTEPLERLIRDTLFWQYQSNSLAIFVNDDVFETFQLPHRFTATVDVADRFYLKPLLRTLTFPQSAYVLALAQNSVRLIKVTADNPAEEVDVPDMPTDLDSYLNLDLAGRTTYGRGAEDLDLRAQQYTAAINRAVLPILRQENLPLILASAGTMASAYRRTNSYKFLLDKVISGNPENLSPAVIADKARPILDALYAEEITEVREAVESKFAQGLGSSDLEHVARAAVFNAIDVLMVDIDQRLPGFIDEDTAEIIQSSEDDAANYGIADEILRRTLMVDGKVYAVRAADMPNGAAVAATFRYAI